MSLSVYVKKIFASQKARAGEAGQAVLEYILVLVVTVSIILGILYQFNDAFKQFLDNYFGDYIACLLETGELPSLGGDGPTAGECNAGFANFNIASGRPSKESSDGGSGGDSSEGDTSGAGDSGGGGGDSGGRPSSFSNNGGQMNAEYSSGAFAQNNRPPRQELQIPQDPDPEAGASESTDDTGFGGRQNRRIIRRGSSYVDERFLSQAAKIKKKEKVIIAEKPKKQRELAALRKAKFNFVPPEPSAPKSKLDVGGISFAKFLKFMIIAGIIIAIGIFLGGQLLQIKKSWQKSE